MSRIRKPRAGGSYECNELELDAKSLRNNPMKILSIETSCDETAVSLVEATGTFPHATYTILGNALFSQIDIHREYGGVFPSVAKREHARTLVPMLEKALSEAHALKERQNVLTTAEQSALGEILSREPGLGDALISFFEQHAKPDIDLIAVTSGPGLEPALWVGINFARALGTHWNIPLIPVNHMEGHILSSVFDGEKLSPIEFPALALLISGGHTELILMKAWGEHEKIGETRDDAVGEAFDKVARMLGLPYPGGPEVSKLAHDARERGITTWIELPRSMLHSGDYDFSFSGIKTSVRYALEKKGPLTDDERRGIARDFEDSVTEVLLAKTMHAALKYNTKTIIVGGGVSANTHVRETFTRTLSEYPDIHLFLPPRALSTDNSIMIALVGNAKHSSARMASELPDLHADGNLEL